MLFGLYTLFVAVTISVISAFYSVVGLTAIFPGSFWPIVILGTALEVGKVTAAMWLKLNWHRANITYKLYLVPAVGILMLLTSMGIFGGLSKAHLDQSSSTGNISAQVALLDEKIATEKENSQNIRKALKQMDDSVDQLMSRSTSESGADKAVNTRKSQQRERQKLLADLSASQAKIDKLNEQRAPIAVEVRKAEVEVGPIKYIAALLYGDNPDSNLLERAVRWVIIIIVLVFDPLALVLILSGQQSIKWAKLEKTTSKPKTEESPKPTVNDEAPQTKPLESKILDSNPYLKKSFSHFKNLSPMVANTSSTTTSVITDDKISSSIGDMPAGSDSIIANEHPSNNPLDELKLSEQLIPQADNAPQANAFGNRRYGIKFPTDVVRGDVYIRVDYVPNRMFKFNGAQWIEVDKAQASKYNYDDEYLSYLIERLENNEYDLNQLTEREQDLIEEKIQNLKNDKT